MIQQKNLLIALFSDILAHLQTQDSSAQSALSFNIVMSLQEIGDPLPTDANTQQHIYYVTSGIKSGVQQNWTHNN